MGLSSKQVSSGDGLDWGQVLMQTTSTTLELSKPPPPSMRRQQQQQQQQQQLEPLKCPRCDSVNTKFCYYNNYNKSQPRHFCKSCKRHWTKGGTLRNVPVGGGRKNKRLKTSNSAAATTTATTTVAINNDINRRNNTHLAINQTHQHHHQNVPLLLADHQKSLSDILYQSLIRPPYSLQHDSITNSSRSNNNNFNGSKNNGIFMGSSSTAPLISLPQEPSLQFPFSSSSTSFESNPSSISTSFQSSNVYNYVGKSEAVEDSTITHLMPTTAAAATSNSVNITHHQPWQHVPITTSSAVMDMPASYWNWDDINTFVSTDLNLQWDDFELKP